MDTLEERFRAPANWQTGRFDNSATGHSIFYGWAAPENPIGTIVCLNGLSEFTEKYYELARDMIARGYAFYTMDWAYQGRSHRLAEKLSHRRHSDGYDSDITDFHKFMTDIVRPAAKQPLILMAHSMGANLALRYLADHSEIFSAAAFTAPLLGIKHFTGAENLLLNILSPLFPQSYVPFGSDWKSSWRKSDGTDKFSTDAARDALHNLWCLADASLQVGNPTLAWVKKSLESMGVLSAPGSLEKINIPVLIAVAGKEDIVSNKAIYTAAGRLQKSTLLDLEDAHHEIFMETDAIRLRLFAAFDKMVKDYKIIS